MIYKIFSVYDAKAQAYLPPFILPRVEQAQRTFMQCVMSEDHQFGAFPEDYTLFELGNFDDEMGQITVNRVQQSHGNGLDYRREFTDKAEKSNGSDSSIQEIETRSQVFDGPSSEDSSQ